MSNQTGTPEQWHAIMAESMKTLTQHLMPTLKPLQIRRPERYGTTGGILEEYPISAEEMARGTSVTAEKLMDREKFKAAGRALMARHAQPISHGMAIGGIIGSEMARSGYREDMSASEYDAWLLQRQRRDSAHLFAMVESADCKREISFVINGQISVMCVKEFIDRLSAPRTVEKAKPAPSSEQTADQEHLMRALRSMG